MSVPVRGMMHFKSAHRVEFEVQGATLDELLLEAGERALEFFGPLEAGHQFYIGPFKAENFMAGRFRARVEVGAMLELLGADD